MKIKIFSLLLTLFFFTACEKTEVAPIAGEVDEPAMVEQIVNSNVGGSRSSSGWFYLDIPSQYYETDSTARISTFHYVDTVDYEGNTYIVEMRLEASETAIKSISCSQDWADAISLPQDCLLTEQELMDELETIMQENGSRANDGFWKKLGRAVRKFFVGETTYGDCFSGPPTGDPIREVTRTHWLTGSHTHLEPCP